MLFEGEARIDIWDVFALSTSNRYPSPAFPYKKFDVVAAVASAAVALVIRTMVLAGMLL